MHDWLPCYFFNSHANIVFAAA
jgi:ribose 5-phosphate isomerase A